MVLKKILNYKILAILSLYFFILSLIFILRESGFKISFLFSITQIAVLNFIGLIALISYLYLKKNSLKKPIEKMLLVFLPAEITHLIGFYSTKHFIRKIPFEPFLMASTLYLFILAVYLIYKTRNYKKISALVKDFLPASKIDFQRIKSNKLNISIIIVVMFLNLGFGLHHLGRRALVDEPLWIAQDGRILEYWSNIKDKELWKTKVSDKPGITTAIVSGVGLIFTQKEELPEKSSEFSPSPIKINTAFRLPLLIFNLLMLPLFFFFLSKLFDRKTALFSTILIGLSPILLGMTTIVNPDALLWVFVPLSLINFLNYLKKGDNFSLYWSGIFLGLGILTKYIANILYPFFLLLIFVHSFINHSKNQKDKIGPYFKKSFKDYLTLITISIITFYIFLPEAWIDLTKILQCTLFSQAFLKIWPFFALIVFLTAIDIYLLECRISKKLTLFFSQYQKIILKSIFLLFILLTATTLLNIYLGMKFYDFEQIMLSPKSSSNRNDALGIILADFYSLIFAINPIAFLAVIFLLVKNLISKKAKQKESSWIFYIVLFILIYYLASTFSEVSATVRYQIVNYPLILILAALGLKKVTDLLKKNKNQSRNFKITSAVFLIII
ncbi:MAG: phospholipid carrier-dependent glycosyltransferase, partial [Candidatus Moranbacteria bacterium]|nr:phospholipid carrier-dependent glycosyltransferase [Candidatus Moranbacteria bacterium]